MKTSFRYNCLSKFKGKVAWKSVLLWFFVLVWMGNILTFSSQPAEISEKKSGYIVEFIQHTLEKLGFVSTFQTPNQNLLDHYVRKTAHMFNYFVLIVLLLFAWKSLGVRKIYFFPWGIFPWGMATLFAGFDEFYQTFIPGRSGMFRDVLFDQVGVLSGLCVFYIITKRLSSRSLKQKSIEQ